MLLQILESFVSSSNSHDSVGIHRLSISSASLKVCILVICSSLHLWIVLLSFSVIFHYSCPIITKKVGYLNREN